MKSLSGLDAQSQKVTNVAAPTAATDAANKGYVDGLMTPIQIPFFCAGSYNASELLGIYVATTAFIFPANFAGSLAVCNQTATATKIFNLLKGSAPGQSSVAIGTLTFANGSFSGTFATNSGASVSVGVGERLTLQAPASTDTTLANWSVTFVGVR